MKSGIGALAIAMLLATVTAAPAEAPSMTGAELRRLPDQDIARRAADQIGDLLSVRPASGFELTWHERSKKAIAQILSRDGTEPGDITNAANRARLGKAWFPSPKRIWIEGTNADQLRFITHRTAVLMPGLCVYDVIPVIFAIAAPEAGLNDPMRAVSITVFHQYHFLTPPTAASVDRAAFTERAAAQAACAQLEGKVTDDIMAEDDESALRAAWLEQALRKSLQQGIASFPVDCNQMTGSSKSCREVVPKALDGWHGYEAHCAPTETQCDYYTGTYNSLRITAATGGAQPAITSAVYGLLPSDHGQAPTTNTITVQSQANAPPPPMRAPAVLGRPHECTGYYPPDAVVDGRGGKSAVKLTITVEGTVIDPSIDMSSGDAELDNATLACVKTWRYRPAIIDSKLRAVPWKKPSCRGT